MNPYIPLPFNVVSYESQSQTQTLPMQSIIFNNHHSIDVNPINTANQLHPSLSCNICLSSNTANLYIVPQNMFKSNQIMVTINKPFLNNTFNIQSINSIPHSTQNIQHSVPSISCIPSIPSIPALPSILSPSLLSERIHESASKASNTKSIQESIYKCNFCEKQFNRRSNLKTHLRIHTNQRKYKCLICLKAFHQRHTLKDHIRTHTGEKPFKCDVCGKAFAVKNNCKVHRRIHTGEKPYVCSICNKGHASKSGYNNHMRRKHPDH